jgi:crooked neck
VLLAEAWLEFERGTENNEANIARVAKLQPKKIKKRRPILGPGTPVVLIFTRAIEGVVVVYLTRALEGNEVGSEEYYDYIFPDEQAALPSLKILEVAHKWKRQKMLEGAGGGGEPTA